MLNGLVGRITFGPTTDASERERLNRERDRWLNYSLAAQGCASTVQACNCIGPQPGERRCPCALRAESEQGRRMVREGVTIDGVEYDLVPKRR